MCLTEPQDFSFFYIDNHERQHAWPAVFCGHSRADLTSPLDMLDNSSLLEAVSSIWNSKQFWY